MKNKKLDVVRSLLVILLGNFIFALGVQLFMVPMDLVSSGITGISLALSYITGIAVSRFSFFLNILMFFVGWALLGRKYAFTTLISSVAFPAFLALLEVVLQGVVLTQNMMLCALFAGGMTGIGVGVVIREGSSTGGVDAIPIACHKYFGLSIALGMYVIDLVVMLAQFLIYPAENVLYGLVNVLVANVVMDKVLIFGTSRIEVQIISENYEHITQKILEQLDRGVTLLDSRGGYLRQPSALVMSVVSNRELPKLQRLVESIDPGALMIVSRVSQVNGRGFTLEKEYR